MNNGWKNIGSACCGPAGSIVIYDTTSKGMDHAAFSMGGGLISQHNPYRCRLVPTSHHSHLLAFVVFFALSVASICHASSSHAFALQHQRRVGQTPCLLQRLLMHRAMLRRCHFVTFREMLPLLNRWWCCD